MTEQPLANAGGLFGRGAKNDAYAQYFTGQSYLNGLVTPGADVNVGVGNVTFEPGCRNHWHIHHHGYQILLVTDGTGLYQEAGKPARLLHPGDVVVTHDGVKHWHGATPDSCFTHVAITTGTPEWLEAVSDAQFTAAFEQGRGDA
ncbi:cupin domain-containing protein [Nicoliella spurrieriana]|uniref:Cupin domain-containing protein n=1 Tax=Nicoliella spurrieriana TaxID=2925830 RepID=A0A976X6I5_9LACO|nr:cupin domain-containing protein [Nicoliella spurrieriana]UQS87347.1 cupin domain-containing protein [Nicoliella spurrieriana]